MKRLAGLAIGIVLSAVGWAVPARGAEADAKAPVTAKIAVYPAAAPSPALKYQLLPTLVDRRPGNAAVDYGKVTAEQTAFFGNQQLQEKIGKWLQGPLDQFPKDEVRKEFQPPLHFLRLASRRESCDWQLPIRDEMFFAILLPELQQLRTFGRILALQARVHVAFGEYDQAIETLQMGFALGRHAAEQPTLVGGLVGIAIHRQMCERLVEMSQQPDAPNLYWALSTLPRPMVDMRKAVESEMYALYFSFPELRDLEDTHYGNDYWNYRLAKIFDGWAMLESMATDVPGKDVRLFTMAKAASGYPAARKWLLDHGQKAEVLDKMPALQVVCLYAMRTYDEMRDDCLKWMFLPFSEAGEGLQASEQRLKNLKEAHSEIIPLASTLLPAMVSVKNAEVRSQRELAVLRVVSALRLYAAQHGRLPADLAEVKEVPLPVDPVRNAPFVYRGEGANSAVLELPSLPGKLSGAMDVARYEIELKQPAAAK